MDQHIKPASIVKHIGKPAVDVVAFPGHQDWEQIGNASAPMTELFRGGGGEAGVSSRRRGVFSVDSGESTLFQRRLGRADLVSASTRASGLCLRAGLGDSPEPILKQSRLARVAVETKSVRPIRH